MELPITWDTLKAFAAQTIQSREETLNFYLTEELVNPQEILHDLKEHVRQSIIRKDKRTHFAYEVAQYSGIYRTFGTPEIVDKEIVVVISKYLAANFPTARHMIEVTQRDVIGTPISCSVVIHFNLPWLSGQAGIPN